jgi:hypothetical protein
MERGIMERGSAHHGPRIDDELANESAPLLHGSVLPVREHEDLEPEALTAEEEVAIPLPGRPDTNIDGPTHADVIARSELARWLLPSAFPANAATLASVAREQGAPADVTATLDGLSTAQRFETVGELWATLGGTPEHRPTAESDAPPRDAAVRAMPIAPAPAEVDIDAWPESGLEPLVRLITFGPRIAIATIRAVGRVVGRSVSALTNSA